MLSTQQHFRGVQDTEIARAKYEAEMAARDGSGRQNFSGNLTANYNVHRREYAISRGGGGRGGGGDRGGFSALRQESGGDGGRGGRGGGRGGAARHTTSTDDQLVDRFRKQSSRRH